MEHTNITPPVGVENQPLNNRFQYSYSLNNQKTITQKNPENLERQKKKK